MSRVIIALAATLALAACDSASAPTRPVSPSVTSTRDVVDSVPNANCLSGWSVANGRCL